VKEDEKKIKFQKGMSATINSHNSIGGSELLSDGESNNSPSKLPLADSSAKILNISSPYTSMFKDHKIDAVPEVEAVEGDMAISPNMSLTDAETKDAKSSDPIVKKKTLRWNLENNDEIEYDPLQEKKTLESTGQQQQRAEQDTSEATSNGKTLDSVNGRTQSDNPHITSARQEVIEEEEDADLDVGDTETKHNTVTVAIDISAKQSSQELLKRSILEVTNVALRKAQSGDPNAETQRTEMGTTRPLITIDRGDTRSNSRKLSGIERTGGKKLSKKATIAMKKIQSLFLDEDPKVPKTFWQKHGQKIKKFLYRLTLLAIYIIAVPILLLLAAYNYDNKNVKNVVNFSILGVYLGAGQLAIIYQMIDLPILREIKELEGQNKGLVNSSEFVIVNKRRIFWTLSSSAVIQIICGQVLNALDINFSHLSIIITSLLNLGANAIFWFMILFMQGNQTKETNLKRLRKEIISIEKFRKTFWNDVQETKKDLDELQTTQTLATSINNKAVQSSIDELKISLAARVASDANIDVRKLNSKKYDFQTEAKKIKDTSIISFLFIGMFQLQILVLVYIIKLVSSAESIAVTVVIRFFLPLVGIFFGNAFYKTSILTPKLTIAKTVSIICSSATYRFLLFRVTTKAEMWALVALKFASKIIIYLIGIFLVERGAKKFVKTKEVVGASYFDQALEDEYFYMRYTRFWFQRFILIETSDLYYNISAMVVLAGMNSWFTSSLSPNLTVKIGDLDYYQSLSGIEIAVEIVFTLMILAALRFIFNRKVTMKGESVFKEMRRTITERTQIVINFQTFALFMMMLVFFNQN